MLQSEHRPQFRAQGLWDGGAMADNQEHGAWVTARASHQAGNATISCVHGMGGPYWQQPWVIVDVEI